MYTLLFVVIIATVFFAAGFLTARNFLKDR